MKKVLLYFGALFAIVFLGTVGYAEYTVRSQFPQLGHTTIGMVNNLINLINDAIILLTICLFFLPIVGLVVFAKWFFRHTYHESGQAGGYFEYALGKIKPAPPLAIATPKVAGTTVTELKPNVPRLAELIEENALTHEEEGKMLMFQGYRVDESRRYGEWQGVTAITGMQNVGKSITMMMLIIIALMQGAKVVVCDTHHNKPRSLHKKVMCLAGLVTFALTEEQVLMETKKFRQELQDRKNGKPLYPYVIFYDEFNSLIRARNDELREVLPDTMEEASQEGLGFELHLVCAIHDMSNTGIGDARFRSFFNFVYCHKMEAGQSKFIDAFKGKYGKFKTQTVIASLAQGHVMVRDEVNEIEQLIIPNGNSKDALLVRDKVQQLGMVQRREIAAPSMPKTESEMIGGNTGRETQTATLEPDTVADYGSDQGQSIEQIVAELEPELNMVYNLFTHGTKSARDVGAIMKIGKTKANELLNDLQDMGLIVRE